ncbi:hypothetical protein DM860_003429 [Cuscuta australis]|uniref:Protein kinase domain-containing protein n=1 Tax=Cuscuta australis TaxID=267555 RepID=A0A328DHK4_9ASTE|nr:hypothetical protein DM860_003429 [Cuscuta australis]
MLLPDILLMVRSPCNVLRVLLRHTANQLDSSQIHAFCFWHILVVVYDGMSVATQLGSLFIWFHERRFSSAGGIKPEGIMIDNNFNIKVFDFGFLARVREEDNVVPTCYPVSLYAPDETVCSGALLKILLSYLLQCSVLLVNFIQPRLLHQLSSNALCCQSFKKSS